MTSAIIWVTLDLDRTAANLVGTNSNVDGAPERERSLSVRLRILILSGDEAHPPLPLPEYEKVRMILLPFPGGRSWSGSFVLLWRSLQAPEE